MRLIKGEELSDDSLFSMGLFIHESGLNLREIPNLMLGALSKDQAEFRKNSKMLPIHRIFRDLDK